MKFTELRECPFCKSKIFYTKHRVSGITCFKERFDGKEADNEDLYEGLMHLTNGHIYCWTCDRYLGNKEQNNVSRVAEDQIRRNNK